MLEYMKKSFLTGVGLALRSKKEMEELARDFAEKSKLDREEGEKFFEDVMDKYDEAVKKLDRQVEKAVEKVLKKTDLTRQSDFNKLKGEIAEIKKLLKELKADKALRDDK
ncbi:MAG: hypothetical protein RBQ72_13630 [Desulfobacterium sp.]|jgi:polyhydroxyalkanoate synthesis regulator phasin|nr:hypothetical protein [Desulfobacterium sp.]